MHGRTRVLIIDDEYKTLEILGMRLSQDGFDVTTATSGETGLKLAYETHPDAILLDVIMPGMDGFNACRRLREVTDAVIMLVSVKGDSEDVIRGLHSGADDYIVKPYNYLELLARLYACLRRRSDSKLPPLRLQRGEAVLITDPSRRLVFINDGRSVKLTPKEFELLKYLVENRGRVLSADAILINVWGPEYKGERDLVKQFIYRLRNKLEVEPSKPEYIVTVRGSGYAFEEDTRPRGLKKPVQKPRHQFEASPAPQSVEPGITPEGRENPSWASQALPKGLASRGQYHDDSDSQTRATKDKRTMARRGAAVLFFAILVTLGTTFASSYALPGDTLYPVKSLVENFQQTLVYDEVNRAHLHIKFAETRLEEVASLLVQKRYGDIPTAVAGFESEIRKAAWELVSTSGDNEVDIWPMASSLGESLERYIAILDNLTPNAPSEARPSINHAIGALAAESATLNALLMEDPRAATTGEMLNRGSLDIDFDSQGEKPVRRMSSELLDSFGENRESEPTNTSVNSNVDDAIGVLHATPPAVPTPFSLHPILSTLQALPLPIMTSRAPPACPPTPTNPFHIHPWRP